MDSSYRTGTARRPSQSQKQPSMNILTHTCCLARRFLGLRRHAWNLGYVLKFQFTPRWHERTRTLRGQQGWHLPSARTASNVRWFDTNKIAGKPLVGGENRLPSSNLLTSTCASGLGSTAGQALWGPQLKPRLVCWCVWLRTWPLTSPAAVRSPYCSQMETSFFRFRWPSLVMPRCSQTSCSFSSIQSGVGSEVLGEAFRSSGFQKRSCPGNGENCSGFCPTTACK